MALQLQVQKSRKGAKNCAKCRKHDSEVNLVGHKLRCPFELCPCNKCHEVNEYRAKTARRIASHRQKKKEGQLAHFPRPISKQETAGELPESSTTLQQSEFQQNQDVSGNGEYCEEKSAQYGHPHSAGNLWSIVPTTWTTTSAFPLSSRAAYPQLNFGVPLVREVEVNNNFHYDYQPPNVHSYSPNIYPEYNMYPPTYLVSRSPSFGNISPGYSLYRATCFQVPVIVSPPNVDAFDVTSNDA